MATGKKSKTEVRAERIRTWEEKSGKNLRLIENSMSHSFKKHIIDNKYHYTDESDKIIKNNISFIERINSAIYSSTNTYIEWEIGHSQHVYKKLFSEWNIALKKLMSSKKILTESKVKKFTPVRISEAKIEWHDVTRQPLEAISDAIDICREAKKTLELRGANASGAAILSLDLFDNLEWCFKRKITRNFDISPSEKDYAKDPRGSVPEFVNPDIKLIHVLVSIVEADVSIGHIQQALKRISTKHT